MVASPPRREFSHGLLEFRTRIANATWITGLRGRDCTILSDVGILPLAWLKFHRADDVKPEIMQCVSSPHSPISMQERIALAFATGEAKT